MSKQSDRIMESNRRVLQRMQCQNDTLMTVETDKTWFPPRPIIEKFQLRKKIVVDVIIPSRTDEKITPILRDCINSIRESEETIKFNIIVVESGDKIVDLGQNKTVKYDSEIFCYNHALNLGLKASNNSWVVLANNDLIFKKDWMHEIIIARNMCPTIESFSPWNDMWNWHPRVFPNCELDIIEGYRIGAEIAGWCIVARRSIFDRVQLSERVRFWYSDNVYADELVKHGIKHALITRSKVDHIVSQTKVVSADEAIESHNDYVKL